jgi:nicotinamide riboside kinase
MGRRYDLFVLCDPGTPFEQDHTLLRMDDDRRARMHRRYREYAEAQPGRVIEVAGSPGERTRRARASAAR